MHWVNILTNFHINSEWSTLSPKRLVHPTHAAGMDPLQILSVKEFWLVEFTGRAFLPWFSLSVPHQVRSTPTLLAFRKVLKTGSANWPGASIVSFWRWLMDYDKGPQPPGYSPVPGCNLVGTRPREQSAGAPMCSSPSEAGGLAHVHMYTQLKLHKLSCARMWACANPLFAQLGSPLPIWAPSHKSWRLLD